jgi:hypothetical protein
MFQVPLVPLVNRDEEHEQSSRREREDGPSNFLS